MPRKAKSKNVTAIVVATRPPKPRQAKRRGRKQRPMRGMSSMHGAERICSLSDPFCSAAWSAKYPSRSTQKSIVVPLKFRTTLTTNAAGDGAVLVGGMWDFPFVPAATVSGGAYTFTTGTANPYAFTPSGIRINTAGFRVRNIAAPLNASGMVRFRGVTSGRGSSIGALDSTSYNYDYSEDIPLQYCDDTCVILRKATTNNGDGQYSPPLALQPSAAVSGWFDPTILPCLVAISGGPASVTVCDIEIYINAELIFQDADPMAIMLTPAARPNTALQDAAAYVSKTVEPIVKGGITKVRDSIMKTAVRYVVSAAGAAIGGYFGGPSGAIAGGAGMKAIADSAYAPEVD